MTNTKFLQRNNLKPPASWDDLLNPAYKGMLQMADARTSGTAVTRIFSIIQVNNRNEDAAFAYMKKLRQNMQAYTKSGGGGTLPVGLGQAGGGIFFIVDALFTRQRATTCRSAFPRRASAPPPSASRWSRAARTGCGQEADRLGDQPRDAEPVGADKINFLPAHPESEAGPDLAAMLKGAKIIEIDDAWAGANRQRIVARWVSEVLNS